MATSDMKREIKQTLRHLAPISIKFIVDAFEPKLNRTIPNSPSRDSLIVVRNT